MTVPMNEPAHDLAALRELLDEGYSITLTKATLNCCEAHRAQGSGYRADLTGPLGSQATGTGESLAEAIASVWPFGDAPYAAEDDPGADRAIDAADAAVLAGKITALREYVDRVASGERTDLAGAMERVGTELARLSVILAAATEDIGDDTDDLEPYCTTCGEWVHIFHGYESWRHFTGEGTATSPVELYEAGHEAVVAWTIRPGLALAPADISVIRDALADAYASQWHRDKSSDSRTTAYAALLGRLNAAGSVQ
jgi:hypothetical protein